jgi:hypothetical protein
MRHPIPPALPGLPVFGNLLEFNRDRYGLLQRGYDTFGPIFSLRLGPKRAAVLIGPQYHQRFFEDAQFAYESPRYLIVWSRGRTLHAPRRSG